MCEGVIQFDARHVDGRLRPLEITAVEQLLGWRSIMRDCGLLGADPARYGGLGFGNVSTRVGPQSSTRGRRSFVVSGTQTSGRRLLDSRAFAAVDRWSLAHNRVESRGAAMPSSESLTHATIYDHGPNLRAVLHAHSPDIWSKHGELGLPTTPKGVDYGTVAMADAAASLFQAGRVHETQVFVMLGHEDGVVAFGRSVDEAGRQLMSVLARARRL